MAIRALLVAAALALATPATPAILEGRDYSVLPVPQPGSSPGRIEVIEFFSYGCPHCYTFHPLIMKWAEGLPDDVAFRRVPVGFGRPAWSSLARAFYTFESTGTLSQFDSAIFEAVHRQRLPLVDGESIAAWVGHSGGDEKAFRDAFDSFGIHARVSEAEKMVRSYRVDAVPQIVVDGRYVVNGRTYQEMLKIADQLIARVRAERGRSSGAPGGP